MTLAFLVKILTYCSWIWHSINLLCAFEPNYGKLGSGSLGLVVIGWDSCSEGCEFESQFALSLSLSLSLFLVTHFHKPVKHFFCTFLLAYITPLLTPTQPHPHTLCLSLIFFLTSTDTSTQDILSFPLDLFPANGFRHDDCAKANLQPQVFVCFKTGQI